MAQSDAYKRLLEKVQGMDLGSGGGFWKPKEGRSVVRILPPVDEMEFFFVEVGRHFKQKQYCPAITTCGDKPCPICELNEILYQSGDKDAAATFRASRAFWVNMIDRNKEDAGVQVWTPGITVFQTLVAYIADPDYGDITDLEDGFDIKLDRKGTDINTEYTVIMPRDPSALGTDDQMDEWMEAAEDLQTKVTDALKSYEELIEAAGIQAYFTDDDEEDDTPSRRASEPVDDDDAPAPTRRSSRRRRQR